MTAPDQATLLLVSISLLLPHTVTAQEIGCIDGKLRLKTDHKIADTRPPGVNSGSVQYCVDGTWNTVCRTESNADSYSVMCAQLGYTFNSQAKNPANCSYSSVNESSYRCVENEDFCDQVLKVTCQTWHQVLNQAQSMCTDSSSTTKDEHIILCQGMNSVPEAEPTSNPSSTSGPEKKTHHPYTKKDEELVSVPQENESSTSTKNFLSHDQCLNTIIPLGSVLCTVVVVLIVSLMVTCVLWRREVTKQRKPYNLPDTDPLTLYRNESYTTHQLDNHIHSATTPSTPDPHSDPHSDLGSNNYHVINRQVDTYEAVYQYQQPPNTQCAQPEPVTPTPVSGEASRREEDFYDAEEHTYSVVNKKRSKKTPQDGEGEREEPPDYEMAMTGEISWGVMNGESSQQAETT